MWLSPLGLYGRAAEKWHLVNTFNVDSLKARVLGFQMPYLIEPFSGRFVNEDHSHMDEISRYLSGYAEVLAEVDAAHVFVFHNLGRGA